MFRLIFSFTFFLVFSVSLFSQSTIGGSASFGSYTSPKEYEIGGITVSGVKYLDHNVLVHLSGLEVGTKITVPGSDVITQAIRKLWKQGLFSDIEINVTKTIGSTIFLDINLTERPRLSSFTFSGLKKGEVDDIRETIKLVRGSQVTEHVVKTVENKILDFLYDKRFLFAKVTIVAEDDTTLANNVILHINVSKGSKVKIGYINIIGNSVIHDAKLRRAMKETKQKTWYNIMKTSKYIEKEFAGDKKLLIAKYNEKGYRDATIVRDSIYRFTGSRLYEPSRNGRDFIGWYVYDFLHSGDDNSKFESRSHQKVVRKSVKLAKKYKRKGYYISSADTGYVCVNSGLQSKKIRKGISYIAQKVWFGVYKKRKVGISFTDYYNQKLVAKYKQKTKKYTDVQAINDSLYFTKKFKHIAIDLVINEGRKYYFREITWVGNTKYTSEELSVRLGIKKGEVFNQAILDEKLFVDPNGVFSLYQDDGYLFSTVTPVEMNVEGDSIDLEMRIYEGKQARINNVTIIGNTKTNDHVIRREIRTKPGQLYNRSDIQRTIRELAQLGYFDPEKLNVDFDPKPADGTVDIEYTVEEKPSDQVELSGGWGANTVVGTLGLTFNNFSSRNMFDRHAWRPLPAGDGQRLSIRAQTNGLWYQAYNMSFVEPWMGGKKPNSLSFSVYHNVQSNGKNRKDEKRTSMMISGVALGLGKRLQWPDDYFTFYGELSYQHYNLNKYDYQNLFTFNDGYSNNISGKLSLSRSSVDQPIYPRKGSLFSMSVEFTPPYSLFKEDQFWVLNESEREGLTSNEITQREDQRKYLWIEYHKWGAEGSWFTRLGKSESKLVLNTRFEFGYIGFYNGGIGPSPFEGYYMGGDGLMTFNLYGKETIPLRGYDNGSVTPMDTKDASNNKKNGNIYDKFVFELRYPLSLNPSATLYVLAFAEAGNAWYEYNDFNPFDVKKAAGVGVRIFLPMFGKLGVDWGYGFDNPVGSSIKSGSQFHFILGQNF